MALFMLPCFPWCDRAAEVALTPEPPPALELGPDERTPQEIPLPCVTFTRSWQRSLSEPVR